MHSIENLIFDLSGVLIDWDPKRLYRKIYQLLLDQYELEAPKCLFIDDNLRNVQAAEQLGIHTIHFKNAEELKVSLKKYNLF